MTHWLRFEAAEAEHFGTLDDETVTVWTGDMFADPQPTSQQFALTAVRILMPCRPSKMIGLWNNFHERATKEGLHRPEHPLYFLKSSNCFAGHGDTIYRPGDCDRS
jgi:2-keto-4-pentenoate hydratase/2-oxohepta-3-ene-1,7-dioic acid hydratase in catechol pathway